MKRESISHALNMLDDRHITDTVSFAPELLQESPGSSVRLKKKRILSFALAAALILAMGITSFAIFGIRGTATHSMPETGQFTGLTDFPKVERIIGYPIIVPESFSNGYRFSQLRLDGMADYDDNGEMSREYYGVNITYTKPGEEDIKLNITPVHTDISGNIAESSDVRLIEGHNMYFRLDTYKLVPEGYEKTADDLAREEAGHFFVSYGSEEISETELASVCFDSNGTRYTLLAFGADKASLEMLGDIVAEMLASSNER